MAKKSYSPSIVIEVRGGVVQGVYCKKSTHSLDFSELLIGWLLAD